MKCAVVGASGYIGGELARLLLGHPNVELVAVTGRESAGKMLGDVHPNLAGVPLKLRDLTDIGPAEVVFLSLPNGETMKVLADNPTAFSNAPTVIDTSADFRLHNQAEYTRFYRTEHPCFELAAQFTYGQPELFAGQICESRTIAAPGCFATATILALYPLVAAGLAEHIVVNAVTGSSGSGAKVKEKTHHPFRADSFYAYESLKHRHIPEIRQALKTKTGREVEFIFQPHSGPFVRGIFVTAAASLNRSVSGAELHQIYADAYEKSHFVRMVKGSPNIKYVQGTNFCDIGVEADGQSAVVMAAIDNLIKGGAGQAVQCFNLIHGFPETAGLNAFSLNP
ncbi:MAG: N-acetyl-gamma-glutamyl-phosphate reductase [Blastocatellia bacterium]|nr:N-acetyl-gamma-glutamyl-phosphate reductase [Blastocatellia bacterium]